MPPQEQIDFPELTQPFQRPAGHQAVVGVVEHRLRPHKAHQPVKALGGKAFEEGILGPAGAHAVDDVAAFLELVHHGVHRVHVVLQVRIHGDGHIAAVFGRHQPGQQGVLVAAVAGQVHPGKQGALLMQGTDDLPGPVL